MLEKIYAGRHYNTATATELGKIAEDGLNQTLYVTSKNAFFLVDESTEKGLSNSLFNGRTGLIPLSAVAAESWALNYSLDALMKIQEMKDESVLDDIAAYEKIEMFRNDSPEDDARHEYGIIFKSTDSKRYIVASNSWRYTPCFDSTPVIVSDGGDGVFAENLYLHYMSAEEFKRWAEDHISVDLYIKILGSVEAA